MNRPANFMSRPANLFNKTPKNHPDCIIFEIWVFNNFASTKDCLAKFLQRSGTSLSVINSLRR